MEIGAAMEKYQSCILHHWKQATANCLSVYHFLKQPLRNTLRLSVVAHREWSVLTHFRWPEVRICHETAELCSKYFQQISLLPFCPTEREAEAVSAAGDSSCWHSSWRAPPEAGQILCNRVESLKPQEAAVRTILPLSIPAELGAWKSQPLD